jgi:hypothetical protein
MLSEYEVAFLLRGVGADEARRVGTRLRQMAMKLLPSGSEDIMLGVATQSTGAGISGVSLVSEARHDASRYQNRSRRKGDNAV